MEAATSEACAVEHIIKALHQQKNPGPANAASIRKALPKPVKPSASALEDLLRDGVRQGELWEYFPKGDVPHYWTQSPQTFAWNKIESDLRLQDVAESRIRKTLGRPEFQRLIDPAEFLSQLVAEGKLFPKSKGRTLKYSLQPIDIPSITNDVWNQVKSQLSVGPAAESVLKKLVKPILQGVLEPDEFLRGLLADSRIHRIPSSGKSVTYSLEPIDYTSYAIHFNKLVTDFAKKMRQTAGKLGLPESIAIEFTQAELRNQFGIQPPSSRQATTSTSASPDLTTTDASDNELLDQILEVMPQINPRVIDGDLVLIPQLRQRLNALAIDKQRFDQALLTLFRQRRVVLSRISPALINDAERAAYVIDEEGNYYNTVALWRDA